jgi:hypothetical protein
MTEIPRAVLSEQFQLAMKDRVVRSAVFLTFMFEPDFFEQEVLPAVLPDTGFGHIPDIRILQLEEILKKSVDHVAVYYDRDALMAGSQSAKLDVRRIPTRHRTGSFHPKNVLLLTEEAEPADPDSPVRHLIVATMSANLTRAGWWENVECCHIEDVEENSPCSFRDDLLDLIRRVKASASTEVSHEALDAIRAFVSALSAPKHRSAKGRLYPRLYTGRESVADFLDDELGTLAEGTNLEVISPYFNSADAGPLQDICDRFHPREIRVYLPRAEDGSAQCDALLYGAVSEIEGARWAKLPEELLRAGKSEKVTRRRVHAKVYRFFDPRRKYEAWLIGSVNLTTAAHSRGGNLETAFLLETEPARAPDWWMEPDTKKPAAFLGSEGDDVTTATTALSVRYDWSSGEAWAFWDATNAPGPLSVRAAGAPLFELDSLVPGTWQRLGDDAATSLRKVLPGTSFLDVSEAGGPSTTILVQEEGMAHKPSVLLSLSAADILHYWALLTPEQRVAFLEAKLEEITEACIQAGIDPKKLETIEDSIFDTFAGIYHSYHALERSVLDSLKANKTKEAEYRLIGKKYDSLPSLIEKLTSEETADSVTVYVTVLCAQQLLRVVKEQAPDFIRQHKVEFRALDTQLKRAARVRDRLDFPSADAREAFLTWFDERFLRRAEPVASTPARATA